MRGDMAEDLLANSEFFAEVDEDLRAQIAALGQRRRMVRGDVLFAEGDDPSELFIVLEGRVAIANRSIDGRESVLALMEAGDLFGEMAMLDGQPRSAEARALEPSIVLAIPYAPVQQMFEEQPRLLWGVVRMLRGGCGPWTRRWPTRSSSTSPAAPRSASSSWPPGPTSSCCRSPRRSWPGWSEPRRERVNKAIASFIRLGWLAQHDRRYKILQRDRLELARPLAVEEGEAAPPGIGGVVGAVGRSVGVVHEAVLGAVVAHDGRTEGTAASASTSAGGV